MPPFPSIFDLCKPRREVLAGELPDAIFAADLWDVIAGTAHQDYRDPVRFFTGTHPTENLKLLVKEVAERLAGVSGGTPVFRLETGFGGGKTHSLIAAVHVAREGVQLATPLADYHIAQFPRPGAVRVAAFVGEDSDPLSGHEHRVDGQRLRTYTPWGQLALLAGGVEGYEHVRENDLQGVAPARSTLEAALGDQPVLILIDELVLYMARAFALREDQARRHVNSQWATFLQTLFSVAARRPRTVVILTLPSEQDANRKLTGELKQFIPTVLETVDELEQTAARQTRNLTPTQSYERAAVLARRLFDTVDTSQASEIASAYTAYYAAQRDAGVPIDSRAFAPDFAEQMRLGYPFHPELIRLFAERLADIPEFQATRGALRLVARTIRGVWERRRALKGTLLLHPQHVDLSRSDLRDEVLARLGRSAFERALAADVVQPEGGTHASTVEVGWPWHAATEAALVVFLHSLPDASRGVTAAEVALAVGRPGCDLAYVARGLEETERRAWYMRREGEHFLFRTRASVNKRFQERLSAVQPGEIRETLDTWVQDIYTGFSALQVIPFPPDHTAIPNTSERVRLVLVHYDKECGAVGAGDRLNVTKALFTKTGVNDSPRSYRNTLVFLLAESSRVAGLKDAVRALMTWERVRADLETEQAHLAHASGSDVRALKDLARRGATGVPAEFAALEHDLGEVLEKLGTQEVNVRTRLLEAYRVLAFPTGGGTDDGDLFTSSQGGPLLECYRVDFGDTPEDATRGRRHVRRAVAEGPILQCLRQHNKLVPEVSAETPCVLAPEVVRRAPLWHAGERRLATEEVWERLRRDPDLPMLLQPTDLLPTLRAGVSTTPDALWTYYDQREKKVYTRDNAAALSPVLAADHFLYDLQAAVAEHILPVTMVAPQEVWDHLWLRDGTEPQPTIAAVRFLDAAKASPHFPVLPERSVLWQALQEGAREHRWVLYLRGPNLAIGAQEMPEWPGTPRFDEATELWTYQAALDAHLYPRHTEESRAAEGVALTPMSLRDRCWPRDMEELPTEDLERFARGLWPEVSRPHLEEVLREGLQGGTWAAWKHGSDETFFTRDDVPTPAVRVGPQWVLVDPASPLAQRLDMLRPGRGPQPVIEAGTPREVLVHLWEALGNFPDVHVAEMRLTVTDRDSFDNTLLATWADRPPAAQAHVSVTATGQREVGGRQETVHLEFAGRFEEVRTMLSPIWPFQSQGELKITIALHLRCDPPLALTDRALDTYRTALMHANQGSLEAQVVPTRGPRPVS